jgi:uncharacterized protein YgiM (DUF1202 family)
MAGFALPKLRWLLAGGLAAGVWVVTQDNKVPRPPARVPISLPALTLPKTVSRPPARPEKIVTGSIAKPTRDHFLRAKSTVNVRARPGLGSPIVARLSTGGVVRELAKSGQWRLVVASDLKGWVHGAYLQDAARQTPRPRVPVLGRSEKQASAATQHKP